MIFELLLLAALIADILFGDPRWVPHPVRGIGIIAVVFEKFFRKITAHQRIAGMATFLFTFILSVGIVVCILEIASIHSMVFQSVVAVIIIYFFIAVRDLIVHSRAVYTKLAEGLPINDAREAIGRIVGRDTADMDRTDVSRACVETVAENMVDGITAPIFWAILFSMLSPILSLQPIALAALGITAYKTINTMDSMFGYKNDRYLYFGWASARIDDLANYLPARLSGFFVIMSAFFVGENWRNSLKVYRRDRHNHSSPNAAHSEAAVAGALGLQLGGPSKYFGKMVDKPTIGDRLQPITPGHILKTNKLVIVSSLTFIVVVCLIRRAIILGF
jgi:adenosylcobinamide-phosphate synthase